MPDVPRAVDEGLLGDPAAAVARDEALLRAVAAGEEPPLLRLWRVPRCLVAPAAFAQRPGFERAAAEAAAAGWPLVLRGSGGGPVPLDAGTLNLSLLDLRPASAPPVDDYLRLLRLLRRGLESFGLTLGSGPVEGAFCDGRFNLTWAGRKLAGTAQRRRAAGSGVAVLAHALLLVDSDLAAGCAAVNAFLAHVGGAAPVRPERHVTLAACGLPRNSETLMPDLVKVFLDAAPHAVLWMGQQD